MPCMYDHMGPTVNEIEASRILCLIDELESGSFDRKHWEGYHPKAYNTRANVVELTVKLCGWLQSVDVTKHSLEMQIWWRDHQEADRERVKLEIEAAGIAAQREAALAKLTPYERELIGV